MVKTLENLLLQNQESFWAESWYIALRTQALPSLFNDDHRLTFYLFTARSNLRLYGFVWGGKVEKSFFFFNMYLRLMAETQCMIKIVKCFS